jgi:hypothetical protein
MSGIKQVSTEVQQIAHVKIAQVSIYNLNLLAQSIDLACKRGAFEGAEVSKVGALYDSIIVAVNKAYDMAEEEFKEKLLSMKSETQEKEEKNVVFI